MAEILPPCFTSAAFRRFRVALQPWGCLSSIAHHTLKANRCVPYGSSSFTQAVEIAPIQHYVLNGTIGYPAVVTHSKLVRRLQKVRNKLAALARTIQLSHPLAWYPALQAITLSRLTTIKWRKLTSLLTFVGLGISWVKG